MTLDPDLMVDPELAVEVPERELAPSATAELASVGAIIRNPPGQVIRSLAHVQAFADALLRETGASSFGTYLGHSPTPGRAIDAFTPVTSSKLGDAMSAFALANWVRFGLRYMIYRQRIHWGPGESWEPMADRGDNTQNHFDHVHFAFEETASPPPDPQPQPEREPEMFTYSTAPHVDGGSIWFVVSGVAHRLHLPEDADRLDKAGVPNLGEMTAAFHGVFAHVG